MQAAPRLLALCLPLALGSSLASAQAAATRPADIKVQTLYLKNAAYPNDLNEILTTIRNMLPASTRIYSVPAPSAIVLEGTPEEFQLARQIIDDLDRPRKSYRLSYTITEFDGTRRVGTQHVTMNLASGSPSTIKQGSRVPVLVSAPKADSASQYTYVDVGLNVSATVTAVEDGANVKTKIEQSSVAAERSSPTSQNPEIRQTTLEDVSTLTQGKPTVLGSLDLPGSTHHLEIEALLEPKP